VLLVTSFSSCHHLESTFSTDTIARVTIEIFRFILSNLLKLTGHSEGLFGLIVVDCALSLGID